MCNRSLFLNVLFVLALGLAACGKQKTETASPAITADQDLVAIDSAQVRSGRIQCEAARLAPFPELLRVTGQIGVDENHTSVVSSVVDGRIAATYVNVGDYVEKGRLLAQLHCSQVHEARSEYVKAQAEFNRRTAELEFSTNARNRAARLFELKAISLEQLQRSETDLRNAELGIKTAQAEINRVSERLRHLGLTAESAEEEYSSPTFLPGMFEDDELVPVLAPISGTVLKRSVNPGKVVTPADDLMLITDLKNLWVNAEVPEKYLPELRIGRSVDITVQAYDNRVFPGRITFIGDTLNPDTRTVRVRCDTNNSARLLKPEMYATISFELGEARQAVLVSSTAIQEVEGQAVVFVREDDARFRVRKVRAGRSSGGRSELLEGLKSGDVVAAAGSFLLKSELLKQQVGAE